MPPYDPAPRLIAHTEILANGKRQTANGGRACGATNRNLFYYTKIREEARKKRNRKLRPGMDGVCFCFRRVYAFAGHSRLRIKFSRLRKNAIMRCRKFMAEELSPSCTLTSEGLLFSLVIGVIL